jgi:hypothetical protein
MRTWMKMRAKASVKADYEAGQSARDPSPEATRSLQLLGQLFRRTTQGGIRKRDRALE